MVPKDPQRNICRLLEELFTGQMSFVMLNQQCHNTALKIIISCC